MRADDLLDLGGGDVLAAAPDDVLHPPEEVEEAALVAARQVAGVEPAAAHRLLGRLRPVSSRGRARGVRMSTWPVSPSGTSSVVGVDDPDLAFRHGDAHRAGADHLVGDVQRHARVDRRLGAAVVVQKREAEALDQLAVDVRLARPRRPASRTRWSRSSGRGSPLSSSAGIEAIVHMSTTSCARTTSQNRETLKRRITTSVPPL